MLKKAILGLEQIYSKRIFQTVLAEMFYDISSFFYFLFHYLSKRNENPYPHKTCSWRVFKILFTITHRKKQCNVHKQVNGKTNWEISIQWILFSYLKEWLWMHTRQEGRTWKGLIKNTCWVTNARLKACMLYGSIYVKF